MKSPTVIPAAFFATVVLLAAVGGQRLAPSLGAQEPTLRLWSAVKSVLQDSVPLYTAEQATAGAETYGKVCAECHEKTDVTSADFKANWSGRSLYEMYEEIRTTMPEDNPGALSREEYAGSVAYILQLNGLPAGPTAVMPDSAAMSAVKITFPSAPPNH